MVAMASIFSSTIMLMVIFPCNLVLNQVTVAISPKNFAAEQSEDFDFCFDLTSASYSIREIS
jgi:hypothetical protein